MPSIVTHHLFAKDVLKKTNIKIKEDTYYVFAQSFDNLFYYKFLIPFQGKEIRLFGEDAQRKNVNDYFKNIIESIEDNLNKETKAYLYGSICHYVLDSICHPYIFYCTGDARQNKKYRGLHEKMEVNLDAYMYNLKTKQNLKDVSISNELIPKTKLSESLQHILDEVFYKTFKEKNIGSIYQQSIYTGNFLLKHFVTDKTGIKKILYKGKDIITFWSRRKYQYLSFHVTKINKEYLNEKHSTWNYPVNKEYTHNESFLELYEKAISKASYIINSIEDYWNKKISKKEVLSRIENNSYVTGIDCNKKLKMKYFKEI